MDTLKSNQQRVKNLTPLEIWAFIVGRVLVAFGLGVLTVKYFPAAASQLGFPTIVVGLAILLFATKGLVRKPDSKD